MTNRMRHLFQNSEFIILAILLLLIAGMSQISPVFFTMENLFDILRSSTFVGICSIGFLVVLISGGVDISFTATATVAQYALGLLLMSNAAHPVVIIAVPLSIGICLGAINAGVINWLKAPAIIITIASYNAYYGSAQFVSKGKWLYDFPKWFVDFPNIQVISYTAENGTRNGLSILTVIWFVTTFIGGVLLRYSVLGRKIYAIGGSLESARRVGINVGRIRLFCYAFLGFFAGIGAVLHAAMTKTIAPNALIGLEFNVLSAVVLGGASIAGGGGSVLGTTLGVLLIAVVTNGLTLMQVPNYWHQVFIGAILLFSVFTTATRERIAKGREGGIHVEE